MPRKCVSIPGNVTPLKKGGYLRLPLHAGTPRYTLYNGLLAVSQTEFILRGIGGDSENIIVLCVLDHGGRGRRRVAGTVCKVGVHLKRVPQGGFVDYCGGTVGPVASATASVGPCRYAKAWLWAFGAVDG